MKLRSVVLTTIVVLSMVTIGGALLPATAAAAGNTGGGAGNTQVDVDATDLDGSGTETDPYVVTNASELQAMEDDPDAHYELGNDIDASATENWTQSNFTEIRDEVYITAGTPTEYYNLYQAPVEPGTISVTDTSDGSSVNFTLEDAQTGNISISEDTSGDIRVTYHTQDPVNTGFDPVGTADTPFIGSFDGNGHTVDGVTINRTDTGTDVGLFGQVGTAGTVSNVSLTAVNISVENTQLLNRFPSTGGLVGYNKGTVENVSTSGEIRSTEGETGGVVGTNDGTITRSSADVSVQGLDSAQDIGGLVGFNGGLVNESYAMGDIEGEFILGGLVGSNGFGQINDSYATGNVTGGERAGGLVGSSSGDDSIVRSYATGTVTGDSDTEGLVGYIAFNDPIAASYWDVQTTTQDGYNGAAVGLRTIEMNGDNAETYMYGLNFSTTWSVVDRQVGDNQRTVGYPVLQNNTQSPAPGFQTVDNTSDYSVTVDSVNSSVQPYEYVEVTTTIENVGWAAGTQTVELRVNGTTVASEQVSLDSLEQTSQTFRYATDENDTPAITVAVASENESVSNTVDVAEQPEPVCRIVDYAGSGTAEDPYQVTNVSQLQCIGESDPSAQYVLTSDIDASNSSEYYDGAGFDPIGSYAAPFTGTLDGDGHTVTDLTIDRGSTRQVGLFGVVGSEGEITDLRVESATITGDDDTGVLVGVNNEGSISDVSVDGSVTANGYDTGGLVGENHGDVIRSSAAVDITATYSDVGGLIGDHSAGTVTASSASGTVSGDSNVGGLIGLSYADISASYATGNVSGTSDVGGLVGDLQDRSELQYGYANGTVTGSDDVGGLVGYLDGTIQQGYAVGTVDGDSSVGGLSGRNYGQVQSSYWDVDGTNQTTSDGTATNLTTEEMTGAAAAGNMTGFDFDATWTTQTGDYPVFSYQSGNAPPVASDDAYISEGGASISAPGVLENDIDFDGDSLSVTGVENGASNGNVTIAANGSLEYTPDEGFNGEETIVYEVTDGTNTSTANVTIYAVVDSGRQVSDNEWTSWHNRPNNTNYDSEIDAPRTPVTELWNTEFPDGACCNPVRPIVVNDTLYSQTYTSTFAMDAQTGELVWNNSSVPGSYLGGVAYEDGRLFVSTGEGGLHALDADTGDGIWARSDISTYDTAPAVNNGTVYMAGDDSDMWALNASTGETVWNVTYADTTYPADYATVTVTNGSVYVPLPNGTLIAHDAESGETLWRTDIGYSESTPAVANGTVYITDDGSAPYLHAIDAETGEFVWNATSNYGYTGVSVTDAMVYVATCGDEVFAYNTTTGEQEWSRSGMGCAYDISEPVAVGQYLYVTNYDAETVALNRYTGETEYTITNPTETKYTSPTPYRGTLYFADRYSSGGISAYGGPERPYLNATNTVAGQNATLTVLQEYRNATVENASVTIEGENVTLDAGSDGTTTYEFHEGGTYPVTITAENTTIHRYVETTRTVDVLYRQNFTVDITGTNSPVTAGSTLSVNATVTNVGDLDGTQTVTLSNTNETAVANQTVSLTANETANVTLNWTTDSDADSGTIAVASANDTATTIITIESESDGGSGSSGDDGSSGDSSGGAPSPPPNYAPEAANDTYTVPTDGALSVAATNGTLVNDEDPDGPESDLTATVERRPTNGTLNLSTDGNFEYTPDAGFNGTDTFTYTVSDGDGGTATATVSLVVPAPESELAVAIDSTTSPVEAGETLSVTVTVENLGNATAERTVSLLTATDTVVASQNVTVDGGNATSVTLDWVTDAGDVGNRTLTVTTAESTLSRSVTVESANGGAVGPDDDTDEEIVDSQPDRPGTTVDISSSEAVGDITFTNEMNGTLSVQQVEDIDNSTREAMVREAELTDSMVVHSVLEIEPSREMAAGGIARLNFTIPSSDVADPQAVTILHRDDNGWEQISTDVYQTGDGTLRVSGTVDSFSLFAIVETQPTTDENETMTARRTTEGTENRTTGGDGPGFGVGVTVAALLATALLIRRRR